MRMIIAWFHDLFVLLSAGWHCARTIDGSKLGRTVLEKKIPRGQQSFVQHTLIMMYGKYIFVSQRFFITTPGPSEDDKFYSDVSFNHQVGNTCFGDMHKFDCRVYEIEGGEQHLQSSQRYREVRIGNSCRYPKCRNMLSQIHELLLIVVKIAN